MAKDDNTGMFVLLGAGALVYILYSNGTLQSWFPSLFGAGATAPAVAPPAATPVATVPGAPPPTAPPSLPAPVGGSIPPANPPAAVVSPLVLTVADAATLPYSTAISAAQITGVAPQLDTNLQSGQIPTIAGDSVLAFMLGWGAQAAGASETALGETYIFDGTNWNLQAPPAVSSSGLTVQDAATFPYSPAISAAQIQTIHDQLVTELQASDIPVIAGNSVLAFMLGWGGQAAGVTESVLGENYSFDGANWNLQPSAGGAGMSAFRASRVPLGFVHGRGDYRFRRRMA